MRAKPAGAGAGQALTLLLPCCLAAAVGAAIPGTGDRGLVVLAGLIGVATLVVLARLTLTRRSVGPGAPEAPEPAGTAGTAGTADERQDQADEARPVGGAAWWLFGAGMLSIGLPALRVGAVTLSDLCFLASVGAAVPAALRARAERAERAGRGGRTLPGPLVAAAIAFAIGGLVASAIADDAAGSAAVVVRVLFLFVVWFWLAATLLTTRERVLAALRLWAASAAISGAAAAIQAVFGDIVPGGKISWGRMTGFTQHVNDLGGLCGITLVPAVMLAARPLRRGRVVPAVMLGLVAVGLMLSSSFSGLVSAGVATALWVGGGGRRAAAPLAVLATTGLLLLVLMSALALDVTSPIDRLELRSEQNGSPVSTLRSRGTITSTALDGLARQPFVGKGLDQHSSTTATGQEVHNLLLGAWYEAGILGLLGLLAAVVTIAATGVRLTVSAPDSGAHSLALALTAAFAGASVFAMGQPVLYQRYVWAPAALLMAIFAQAQRSAARTRDSSPPRPDLTPSWSCGERSWPDDPPRRSAHLRIL